MEKAQGNGFRRAFLFCPYDTLRIVSSRKNGSGVRMVVGIESGDGAPTERNGCRGLGLCTRGERGDRRWIFFFGFILCRCFSGEGCRRPWSAMARSVWTSGPDSVCVSPKKVSQDAAVACAVSFGSEELRRLAPWLFSDEVSERINRSLRQTVCHPSPVSLVLSGPCDSSVFPSASFGRRCVAGGGKRERDASLFGSVPRSVFRS